MTLLVLGVSHRSASADLLDKLAVPADLHAKALASVMQREHVVEAAIISTCNRVEVYANVTRYHGGVADLRDHLAEWAGVPLEAFGHLTYDRYDQSAAEHLFAVASGLDSMVVGERQIHAQVRQAFTTALEEGTASTLLNRLFRQAIRVGRRTRAETGISEGAASIVDVALLAGRQALPTTTPVVGLVGAGKIGGMAGARVAAEAERVMVANRTSEKAQSLVDRVGGTAHGLDELPTLLAQADLVVSSTDASQPVISAAALEDAMARRPGRPLVVVDLAVPRDVEADAHLIPGVTIVDIHALRKIVTQGPTGDAIRDARLIVAEEATSFAAWSRGVQAGPTITALRAQADRVRAAEMDRLSSRLSTLDDDQRDAVEALTRGIINTLMHQPTVRLKKLVDTPDGERYVRAISHLFDLDVTADESADGDAAGRGSAGVDDAAG